MKNIVLCSDGTGNTALKGRGTNVWKVFEAVDTTGHRVDPAIPRQVALYDDGVGTEQLKPLKIAGGAFGYGLKRNIREIYGALCRVYEPGDPIYLFGFSRGAYTVRALAGLITCCGILAVDRLGSDRALKRRAAEAYRCFRRHFGGGRSARAERGRRERATAATDAFRSEHAVEHQDLAPEGRVRIRFIGVWDTVDAVGFPIDHIADFWNDFIYPFRFPDRKLSSQVDKGCHAISVDDERHTFHPVLWDESEEKQNGSRIEQIWFAGAHSNVGGGYPKQGMSLVALDWMMAKAEEQGLRFLAQQREDYRSRQNVHDKLYNSRSGLGSYYRYKPRNIARICEQHGVVPKIHVSVLHRISLATDDYAPGNLPQGFEIVSTDPGQGTPAEDSRTLKALAKRVGAKTAGRPLLDRARGWIGVRRYCHLGLLLSSMAILAAGAFLGQPGGPEETPTRLESGVGSMLSSLPFGRSFHEWAVRPLLEHPAYGAAIAGSLVVAYLLGSVARRKCASVFSSHWRVVLPRPW